MSRIPMMPINLENLILNENAYFFKLKQRLSRNAINKIFNESLYDKKAIRKYKPIIRAAFVDNNHEVAKYSLDIFEFRTKPSFLKKYELGKWEVKYGFLLIVEYSEYISIMRKNVSGIHDLKLYVEPIDYNILSHFVLTRDSKFEKIVSSNINTASTAIQRKTTEASDLKGIYSKFGASKQILNSIRVDNKGKKFTVTLNTSRVNSFNLKQNFTDIVLWLVEILKLIKKSYTNLPQSPFIEGFATPIIFESIINNLIPTYLLLRFTYLKDDIENGFIERSFTKEGEEETDFDLQSLINNSERLIPLSRKDKNLFGGDPFQVRINTKSISIRSEEFDKIYLDYGNELEITLTQYINSGNHFIINFDKVDYVYSHHKIFRDSRLLGDIENFLSVFVTYKSLNSTTSEKGLNYTIHSTAFDSNSLFGFISEELANDAPILICDDMGTEWGDFIAIYDSSICFYHAKFHSHGLSAANLEEVLGQASKNLGNLELDAEMIDSRSKRWQNKYQIKKTRTSINRIRMTSITTDIISDVKRKVEQVSANPNIRRKVFIVINFLSKSKLENSISLVKQGKNFRNKGVVLQILWFVNSLLSSANELNTELKIVCRP